MRTDGGAILEKLREAERVIRAYQEAWRDKQAPHIGGLEPSTAKAWLADAREKLLAYRFQAERFSSVPKPRPRAPVR